MNLTPSLPPVAIAIACVLAVLIAWTGLWRGRAQRRASVTWMLLALQPLLAASLYAALFPPSRALPADTLQVLAPGAGVRSAGPGSVALPEATAGADVRRVPDLSTALREQPAARVQVQGAYLPARDRDALAGRTLDFQPGAAPVGLVELWPPEPLAAGATFALGGRVHGMPGARVELRDPVGALVDRIAPGADGRFVLHGQAGAAGDALFALHVLDAAGKQHDRVPVPVSAIAAAQPKLLVLAGAPQPELKYLRRWAIDAGLALRTRIATGAGLSVGDAPTVLDAATLDGFDLVVLDDRALAALPMRERDALGEAMRRGLGVLVRVGGPIDAGTRAALRGWGLAVGGDAAGTASVAAAPAPDADAAAAVPALTRRTLAPTDATSPALARDPQGQPYAWWRPLGRGRLGLSTLTDSYLWALAGRHDLHAGLWSGLLSPLARARGTALPTVSGPAWAGQRVNLCGVGADATVTAPEGARTPLRIDPDTGARSCAGYWPTQAGWHVLHGNAGRRAFYVQDPAQAKAWFLQSQRDATLALAGGEAASTATASVRVPGSRWPWWLAFVCAASLSWWLERRRPA